MVVWLWLLLEILVCLSFLSFVKCGSSPHVIHTVGITVVHFETFALSLGSVRFAWLLPRIILVERVSGYG